MKYVTDGATYTCPASFLFRAQAVLAKSNGEGKALLTTAAKLVSTVPGVVCPRLPKTSPMNPPFICPCVVVPTSWEHPDKKNTAGGNMLLTEDSTKKCPETQEYFKLLKNPNNLVQDGAPAVSIAGIVFPKLAEVAMAAKPSQAKAATPSPVASGGKVSEPPTEKQGKTQPTSKKEQQGGASEGLPLLIGPLCPGCHRASCKYAEASTMSRENSSQKLREAYQAMPENEKDDYDRYYDKLASEKTRITPWSFAAHHIISGNQVFGTVPEIVQLANSYDYDINHAGNCIFLVTKAETLAKEEIQKRASAYDAMAVTQMQWHVGGHSYTFGGDLV